MSERTIFAADGEPFTVRPMTAADTPLVVDGFTHLSVESARQRFFTADVRSLRPELLLGLATPRHGHHVLLAFDGRGGLVGGARGIVDPAQPGAADISVTIGDPWQARGIGGGLLRELADDLRAAGVARLVGHTQIGNTAARALVSGQAATWWIDEPGILGFEIVLDPTAVSIDESVERALQAAS